MLGPPPPADHGHLGGSYSCLFSSHAHMCIFKTETHTGASPPESLGLRWSASRSQAPSASPSVEK